MRNCEDVRELLPLHAVGDTDLADALDLDEHLQGCSACAADLEAYRALCDDLRGQLAAVPPEPGRWPVTGPGGRPPRPAGATRRLLPAWALPAAAALLLAGVLLGRWSSPLQPDSRALDPGVAAVPRAEAPARSLPPTLPTALGSPSRRPLAMSVFSPAVRDWLRQAALPHQ